MFKAMIIAGIGGFFGTCGRYLIDRMMHYLYSPPFPYGTFAVNIIGCLLIGVFYGMAEKVHLLSANMMLLLITGFCGGFTTFSSFSNDIFVLIQQKHWIYFIAYLVLSITLGLFMVWVGRNCIR